MGRSTSSTPTAPSAGWPGWPDTVIDATSSARPPDLASEAEACAHRVTWELTHDHRVDPETDEQAVRSLGHRSVVDMVLLIGLDPTTCSIINAFEIPVPRHAAQN